LLPATRLYTQRQKFQRAFAQEFLCPYTELKSYLGSGRLDDEAIEDAASYFQVSPLLIRTTLVNKGMLERNVLQEVF
jgi:Zn-dependent peptidase ImmA (M78 family)